MDTLSAKRKSKSRKYKRKSNSRKYKRKSNSRKYRRKSNSRKYKRKSIPRKYKRKSKSRKYKRKSKSRKSTAAQVNIMNETEWTIDDYVKLENEMNSRSNNSSGSSGEFQTKLTGLINILNQDDQRLGTTLEYLLGIRQEILDTHVTELSKNMSKELKMVWKFIYQHLDFLVKNLLYLKDTEHKETMMKALTDFISYWNTILEK